MWQGYGKDKFIQGSNGKILKKKLAGRPRRQLEGNIKKKLKEMGCNGIERSGLGSYGAGSGQAAGSCKRGNDLSGSTKCGKFPD
jgi:hypothetical protein